MMDAGDWVLGIGYLVLARASCRLRGCELRVMTPM